MGNMSYCRFENTAQDMADCLDAIEENQIRDLSSNYEVNGLASVLRLAKKIAEYEYEINSAVNNQTGE